jgi:hypothetical protein
MFSDDCSFAEKDFRGRDKEQNRRKNRCVNNACQWIVAT